MKKCPFCAEDIQDAAVVCRYCGRDLAATTPIVSAKAAEARAAAKNRKWAAGVLLVLAIIGYLATRGNSPSSSSNTPSLSADVQFDGTRFSIKNTGTTQWNNPKAEINGIFNGYEYQMDAVAPGGLVVVSAIEFAKKDGTRFNPYQLKPTEFYIYADVPGGRGVWQGGWK